MKKHIISTAAIAALVSTATAATNFTNADSANSFISNALNWSNGLPGASNPGTISINAQFSTGVTHTNYDVVHSAGLLSLNGTGTFALSGSTWLMNGTATTNSRGLNLTNSSTFEIALNSGGTAAFSNNNVDISINSSSSLTVTTGNLFGGRSLSVNGATFTMNSVGTVSFNTTAAFGTTGLHTSGIMNLNAGSITADRFALRGSTDVNFGGTTVGTATFTDWGTGLYTNTLDRAQDNNFSLNFNPGTQMTLTLGAAARALDFTNDSINNPTTLAWAEALWGQNQLLYDGETAADLGLSWDDVTSSSVGFGDGNYFEFNPLGPFGGSLAVVPEPSSFALLGVGIAGLVLIRRRHSA
jgi:hypothetical protein